MIHYIAFLAPTDLGEWLFHNGVDLTKAVGTIIPIEVDHGG